VLSLSGPHQSQVQHPVHTRRSPKSSTTFHNLAIYLLAALSYSYIRNLAARWRPRLREWLRESDTAHLGRHQPRSYSASYVGIVCHTNTIHAYAKPISTSMRSSELRAKPCPESRDHRPDQQQEGFSVGICTSKALYPWLTVHRPREAAVAIVNYVNHRNQNVALLALNVRCAIPFHSTHSSPTHSSSISASKTAVTLSICR
jgi:hypothetical protein